MRIKLKDIKAGDAYVHDGADQARFIYYLEDDYVYYYAFDLKDGRYQWRHRCKLPSFYTWQSRKVTASEFQRLDFETARQTLEKDIRVSIQNSQGSELDIEFYIEKLLRNKKGNH